MAFPLTAEQQKIVEDRGGELLVSAAAGSGKTRVLVERLLDRVVKEGKNIDQFLVITYTKAAASELRARIAQELSSRLAERPNDAHLRRQTTLVYRAQISTIHSFCSELLRESGYLLDLDPDFRLCDEVEAHVLMTRVLEQVLEKRYEGLLPRNDDPFSKLVDTMAAGRDDSRLGEIVLDIYGRIQSHPDPERWLLEQKALWKLVGVTDLTDTMWGRLLLDDVRRKGRWCLEQMKPLLRLCEDDELLHENYSLSIAETVESLESLLRAENWDAAAECVPIYFPAVGRKKKRKTPLLAAEELAAAETAERVKAIRNRCKKIMEKTTEQMEYKSSELLEELTVSAPAVQALMDLVIDFQREYAKEKRRKSLVDFSDLEHFAVRILLDEQGRPRQTAESWAQRYVEVMVDEYQDTNQVQNAIFSAITRGGENLFEVGDVKQSIYRFRLADPTIFLDKYDRFAYGDDAAPGRPRKRVLSRNFRSRPQVLEGCNDLFRSVMSREFGELDYTEDQALVPGAQFPEGEDYALELDMLDLSFLNEQEEGERDNKDFLEACFAARRIRELLRKPLMLTEGDGQRPVRPSDIMILLRSPGSLLHHYIRALNAEGIPWVADGGNDFFNTTEVNVALSILQIVDNPMQDVALIAALRSPVYGFSGDKLAMLRGRSRGDFYHVVKRAAEEGDEECTAFLADLEKLRFGAGDRTCRQLIWHIYERTNLLGIFGAMDNGGERQSNLLALYSLAGQLEESGCRTLFQFLLRLERMKESGAKLSSVKPGSEGEGVNILSIHRSKGLEKPVVLVCGLNRRLNRDDMMRPVLFHPVLGVGPKGLDLDRMIEYPTFARRAVARKLEQEMMAEELRLLYVAMTRAKEKLILSLPFTGGREDLKKLEDDLSVPISPVALERQQTVGGWIALHALTRPEASAIRTMAGLPECVAADLGPEWEIRWLECEALATRSKVFGRLADLPEEERRDTAELTARFSWQYPFRACADIPSKITATQIKGRVLDREITEETETAREASRSAETIYRPQFIADQQGLTPAQKGSALHLAMQFIPLDADHSISGIQREIDSLAEGAYLTKLQAQAVDPARIAAFFESALGQKVKRAKRQEREFKFSLLVPSEEYYPDVQGEELLLQGVVDLWFEDEDGITVVDFKSDRVLPGQEKVRAEHYRPQLETYSSALSRILNRPVTRRVLWFFMTDIPIEL